MSPVIPINKLANLSLTTPAVKPILTTAEAKAHLRVTVADDDALIDGLVLSATDHIKAFTARSLINEVWTMKLDKFPPLRDPLEFPNPPFESITSIDYTDGDGNAQSLAETTDYISDQYGGPFASVGRIWPVFDTNWPTDLRVIPNNVVIVYTGGYGTNETDIPDGIRQAALLLIGHWYEHRESVIVGTIGQRLPQTVEALLWPFRATL